MYFFGHFAIFFSLLTGLLLTSLFDQDVANALSCIGPPREWLTLEAKDVELAKTPSTPKSVEEPVEGEKGFVEPEFATIECKISSRSNSEIRLICVGPDKVTSSVTLTEEI